MLRFDKVSYRYPSDEINIIDGLSFHVKKGEFVSVIGPSGCGKSTIFRLINRFIPVMEGSIELGGAPLDEKRADCAYMPQQDLLLPWRRVEANLRLPLEIKGGRSRAEMNRLVAEALDKAGLSKHGRKWPHELSGGMRQRAAFARTLLTGSELLLLDEPFSALDYLTRLDMREWLLKQWEQERKTVLFITHDVEEAIFLSGRVLLTEGTPIRRLISFEVPAEYPRHTDMLNRPDILALKDQLISLLRRDNT